MERESILSRTLDTNVECTTEGASWICIGYTCGRPPLLLYWWWLSPICNQPLESYTDYWYDRLGWNFPDFDFYAEYSKTTKTNLLKYLFSEVRDLYFRKVRQSFVNVLFLEKKFSWLKQSLTYVSIGLTIRRWFIWNFKQHLSWS